MALVLPVEIHESTFRHMLLVYRKTFFFNGQHECPCATGSTQTVPSFVGSDSTSVSLVVGDILIDI